MFFANSQFTQRSCLKFKISAKFMKSLANCYSLATNRMINTTTYKFPKLKMGIEKHETFFIHHINLMMIKLLASVGSFPDTQLLVELGNLEEQHVILSYFFLNLFTLNTSQEITLHLKLEDGRSLMECA